MVELGVPVLDGLRRPMVLLLLLLLILIFSFVEVVVVNVLLVVDELDPWYELMDGGDIKVLSPTDSSAESKSDDCERCTMAAGVTLTEFFPCSTSGLADGDIISSVSIRLARVSSITPLDESPNSVQDDDGNISGKPRHSDNKSVSTTLLEGLKDEVNADADASKFEQVLVSLVATGGRRINPDDDEEEEEVVPVVVTGSVDDEADETT